MLFEGQTRIAFIKEALKTHSIEHAVIILVDCNDEARRRRLTEGRNQAELANAQMMNWAEYLREEAKASNIRILDTSLQTISESVDKVIKALKA